MHVSLYYKYQTDEGFSNIQVLARQTEHAFNKEGTPKGKNKASVLVGFQNLKEVQLPRLSQDRCWAPAKSLTHIQTQSMWVIL